MVDRFSLDFNFHVRYGLGFTRFDCDNISAWNGCKVLYYSVFNRNVSVVIVCRNSVFFRLYSPVSGESLALGVCLITDKIVRCLPHMLRLVRVRLVVTQ